MNEKGNRYAISALRAKRALVVATVTLIDQYKATEHYSSQARQKYEETKPAAGLDPPRQTDQSKPEAYRDEWRSERDLEAQTEMAWFDVYQAPMLLNPNTDRDAHNQRHDHGHNNHAANLTGCRVC
jgi:hypothetical protein